MAESQPRLGYVQWMDLTVPDADRLPTFYEKVAGWAATPLSMGEYEDFCMSPAGDPQKTVAGICHARGENTDLPAQWLIYITVASLSDSAAQCERLGGRILAGPRQMGGQGMVVVVQDPAGAVAALFEPNRP